MQKVPLNNRGVVILISLGIVAVFSMLAVSVTPMVISSMQKTAELQSSVSAYYAAEAGVKEALYALTHKEDLQDSGWWDANVKPGEGFFTGKIILTPEAECETPYDSETNTYGQTECTTPVPVTATWRIFDTAEGNAYETDGSYSYPIPGTGTAGTTCDPFEPVVGGYPDKQKDFPCEKLMPGDGYEWAKQKCALQMKGGLGQGQGKGQGQGNGNNGQGQGGTQGEDDDPDDGEAAFGLTPESELLFDYDDPKDLPCNWHKIKYGETVQIPLYGPDGGLDFNDFKLRVRTPCKQICDGTDPDAYCVIPELCSDTPAPGVSAGRYVVANYSFEGDVPWMFEDSAMLLNDLLLTWSVENAMCGEEDCFLSNMSDLVSSIDEDTYVKQEQSLLYVDNINDADNYEVLLANPSPFAMNAWGLVNANSSDKKQIGGFLNDGNLANAYFKLSYIKQARDIDSFDAPKKGIPYLEYQLLYETTSKPISTSDPLIVSEGISGGFKQTLQARYNPKTGVINYVVQQ